MQTYITGSDSESVSSKIFCNTSISEYLVFFIFINTTLQRNTTNTVKEPQQQL